VPAETLKETTIRGLRWLAVTRVVGETLAFAAAIALARLIAPEEFGRAAVALILLPLAGILTFEGFASALVQRKEIDEQDRRAAMLMSLVGGALLSLAVFALSWSLWRMLFGAQTAALIRLISPILFIAALGGVSRAALWRALNFRATSLIETSSIVGGYVVAVALAAAGLGAKAIVIGALVQAAVSSTLLLIAAPAPLPTFSALSLRRIAGFGLPAALAGLVEVLFRNVDYAILAARLSATTTGIYYRAFNLGVVYQDKLSGIMVQVAYPVYSRTPDKAELRAMHERAARVHAAIIFPLLASLMVLAPVLIPFLFGSAWEPSVRPTQVLALAGMLAAVLTGYSQVMLAIGRPKPLLWFNIGRLALYAGAVLLASRHGLMTVAVAVVLAYLAILLGAYHFLLGRYVGISLGRLIPELGPAVVGCLALAAVTVPLDRLLSGALPRALLIAIVGTVGLAVYALVLRIGFPAAWTDVRLLIVRVLGPLTRLRGRRGNSAPSTEALAHTSPPAPNGSAQPLDGAGRRPEGPSGQRRGGQPADHGAAAPLP
jgi:O-antigen/teichoic acid export membrane protein